MGAEHFIVEQTRLQLISFYISFAFSAGFSHMDEWTKLNLYQLRLCYQAYIKVGKLDVPLDPVVSMPIYGKSNELTINRLCSCSSKMSGGDEIIMLCDKVSKNNIRIRFFETNDDGDVVWEADAAFQSQDVYKQMAIVFRTPRYRNPEIQHGVQVLSYIFLYFIY